MPNADKLNDTEDPKEASFRDEPEDEFDDLDTPEDEQREVRAKDGDTFVSLAREHLKDSSRAAEVAKLNKHVTHITDGTLIKVPPVTPTFGRYIAKVAADKGLANDPALSDPDHPKTKAVIEEARALHRAHLAKAKKDVKAQAEFAAYKAGKR